MALAAGLEKAGHEPKSIDTKATVHLEKVGEQTSITRIVLSTRGEVPGISEAEFRRMAEDTKKNCIVSRALSSVDMRLEATLIGAPVGR